MSKVITVKVQATLRRASTDNTSATAPASPANTPAQAPKLAQPTMPKISNISDNS